MSDRYIVLPPSGYDPALHDERDFVGAREAMHILLNHDGAGYEIRPEADGKGWRLWTHRAHQMDRYTETDIWSLEADEDAATDEIALEVIARSGRHDDPEALTAEEFREMAAQFAADEQAA